MKKEEVIAGDIGGTHANLGVVEIGRKLRVLFIDKKSSKKIRNFENVVSDFLKNLKIEGIRPERACFAVAGPVSEGRAKMSNAPFVVDAEKIRKKTGMKEVVVINDFKALGFAMNTIPKKDLLFLNKGRPERRGVKGIIGAGTGLGHVTLVYHRHKKAYLPYPSERGHASFPFEDEAEMKIAEFIKKRSKRKTVEYEDVVSGRGIEHLYYFLEQTHYPDAPDIYSPTISQTRKTNDCSAAAFSLFLRFYARAARNFALSELPRGGLYIAGGIAADNYDAFEREFVNEFVRHEEFSDILRKIPLYVIKNYDISVMGSAFALKINEK